MWAERNFETTDHHHALKFVLNPRTPQAEHRVLIENTRKPCLHGLDDWEKAHPASGHCASRAQADFQAKVPQ